MLRLFKMFLRDIEEPHVQRAGVALRSCRRDPRVLYLPRRERTWRCNWWALIIPHMTSVTSRVNPYCCQHGGPCSRKPNWLATMAILAVALSGVFNTQSAALSSRPQQEEDEAAQAVYVMRTGKKYHRSDCRHLAQSRIPMKLKDAVNAGYSPCSGCNPPRLPEKKE